MTAFVALFRGVNVGGKNKLPMKWLADLLEAIGCSNVRTYIRSANAFSRPRARVEKSLVVSGTSRNWRTALKLQAMIRACA